MKKQASPRRGANLNLLCAAAFVSVGLSMALAGPGHAQGMASDAAQTSPAVVHPSGMQAAGTSGANGSSSLPQGVVARVNGVDIPGTQLGIYCARRVSRTRHSYARRSGRT